MDLPEGRTKDLHLPVVVAWITLGVFGAVALGQELTAKAETSAGVIDRGDTAWVLISGGSGDADDAGAGVLLRRAGPQEEHALGPDAVLHGPVPGHRAVGVVGYSLAFGPDFHGIIGGLEWAGLSGRGAGPQPRLCHDHPASGLHDLPGDVRGHHPRR